MCRLPFDVKDRKLPAGFFFIKPVQVSYSACHHDILLAAGYLIVGNTAKIFPYRLSISKGRGNFLCSCRLFSDYQLIHDFLFRIKTCLKNFVGKCKKSNLQKLKSLDKAV